MALTDTWILACSKRHSLPVKAGDTASLARGREAPLLGLLRRPLLACPGPPDSAGSQKWELQHGTEEVNEHLPPDVNVSR